MHFPHRRAETSRSRGRKLYSTTKPGEATQRGQAAAGEAGNWEMGKAAPVGTNKL